MRILMIIIAVLTVAGLLAVAQSNRRQVTKTKHQTCFTVNHKGLFYNSYMGKDGKPHWVVDKYKAGDKFCHSR